MRVSFLPAAALIILLSGCTTEVPPLPFTGDPWPEIRQDRIDRLLPGAMDRSVMESWIVVCRENNNDPIARHVGCENAGGQAGVLFFRTGDGVHSVAVSPSGEATSLAELGIHDEVLTIPRNSSVWAVIKEQLERFEPMIVAINRGRSSVADGLSHTQFLAMETGLGAEWMARTVSAEPLIQEWLAVKTPAEIEIMRRAAALTAKWEVEAYAQVIPGQTTDRDLADILEAKMAAAGVTDGWSPAQNPAINSGKDRGHSHPTNRIIQPGDFIQTDFGIRVHDMWVTDIQRFAYVLAPGQTEAPADALEKWHTAVRGSRAAFYAMRPGVRGVDVDRAQRAVLSEAGSLPIMWGTGHPVGYWAHDSGPGLSGGQEGRSPSVSQQRELAAGMTFAFDGFFSWPLTDSTTKTISVEEMVVVTDSGAEWLTAPQEELILISSR